MRGLSRTIATLALAGMLATGLAGLATAQSVSDLQAAGKVSIGVLIDYPPFGTTNLNNEPDGYDIELAKLLADRMGVQLDLVPVTGPNRIPYLQTSRVDLVIASLSMTPERAQQVQFSTPYAAVDVVVYALKDLNLTGPQDLGGVTIAVARASTQDIALTREAPADAVIQRFDDDASATQALLSGQVQAFASGQFVVAEMEKAAPADTYEVKFPLYRQYQGVGMRHGQDELKDWVNEFVTDLIADGTINKISEKWIGADQPELPAPDYINP